MNLKRLVMKTLLAGAIIVMLLPGCANPVAGGEAFDPQDLPIMRHDTKDDNNGFFYQVWDNNQGSPTLNYTNEAAGRYRLTWNNTNTSWNFVCGKGWGTWNSNSSTSPASLSKIVNYSGSFNPNTKGSDYVNSYLDFYGWANNFDVEYYILESYGEYDPSKDSSYTSLGTYTSNGATYKAYYKRQTGQPSPKGSGSYDFDQLYSIRTPRVAPGSVNGVIRLADHVAQWADYGYNLTSTQFQVMATEGYGAVGGNSDITVSEGSAVDMSSLANSIFSGGGDMNAATPETGDNRGYYTGAQTRANFTTVYPELDIQFEFGAINGSRIELIVGMTIAMRMLDHNGNPTIRLIPAIAFWGEADIVGNTVVPSGAEILEVGVTPFVLTLTDNDTIEFEYSFNVDNAYSGYGVARRNGLAMEPMIIQQKLAVLKPADLPVAALPKIGNGTASVTVTNEYSAYSVESGEWNGIVQLQFTNPASPAVKQIEVIAIDPVDNQKVYDFKAPDSNPNYWGWGGEMKFPQAKKRYKLVIRKLVPNPVSFNLRAW